MSKLLHLTDDLRIPRDLVTQTIAYLAKKRVGKTYTAMVCAEELVKAKLPWVAIDPTGVWWGLRAAADGKKAGLPVIIIGGPHADLPLEPTAGAVIADLVVEQPNYYVLDLSDMNSNSEQDKFAADFAERLYRLKARKRFPLHIFLDEADCFIPQAPFPEQRRMLGAYDTIVRRGGSRGLGISLITQRPAVVSKNVLSQCECLIALQIIGPDDRDAIERWVKANGSKEQRDVMMASLGSLKRGEAWFWSPVWLEVFQKVHIRKKRTFDSSKTPEVGKTMKAPKQLAKVDMEKVAKRIADTIERVKASDPEVLKREVTKWKREHVELSAQLVKVRLDLEAEMKKVKTKPVPEWQVRQIEKLVARLEKVVDKLKAAVPVIVEVEPSAKVVQRVPARVAAPPPVPAKPAPAVPTRSPYARASDFVPEVPQTFSLGRAEKMILAVLFQHYDGCTSKKLALLAGYSWSGGFRNALGNLRAHGFIQGGNVDIMRITSAGQEHTDVADLPTGKGLVDYWRNHPRFGKAERAIIEVLLTLGEAIDGRALAESAGYGWSGGFRNALGALRTTGVIEGKNNSLIRLSEHLLQARGAA